MAETLKLEIVTPEAVVYSEDVLMVTMPCVQGQIGVYPLHVPLITQVVPGEIVVHHKDGHDQSLAVGEGLVDIAANRVSIVTDMAIPADKIDEAKAEEAHPARPGPPRREALGRGSRVGQCVARPVACAAARQTPSSRRGMRGLGQVRCRLCSGEEQT
jgi:F-type H+-transporting ATPase subunit epsilon